MPGSNLSAAGGEKRRGWEGETLGKKGMGEKGILHLKGDPLARGGKKRICWRKWRKRKD